MQQISGCVGISGFCVRSVWVPCSVGVGVCFNRLFFMVNQFQMGWFAFKDAVMVDGFCWLMI